MGWLKTEAGRERRKAYNAQPERKAKTKAQKDRYYASNRDKIHADNKAWAEANPDATKAIKRKWWRKRLGVSESMFAELLEKQHHKCPGCGDPVGEADCLDHCHSTLKVRGVLCRQCNFALGHARDSAQTLRNLASYLEQFL